MHILLIIADGEVTEIQQTVDAIVEASYYPLSIIVVGVGDGPFELMEEFDDKLPQRNFDNFQFVDMTKLESEHRDVSPDAFNAAFAYHCLQEVPEQYQEIRRLGYLGRETNPESDSPLVAVLAPPDV